MAEDVFAHSAWDLPASAFLDCRRPFSFYDFAQWCTKDTDATWPVHRFCNIMRKRQQARGANGGDSPLSVAVEPLATGTPGSQEDDRLIEAATGKPVKSRHLRVSFFMAEVDFPTSVRPGLQEHYMGYFILKQVNRPGEQPWGHILEAVIDVPDLLNNYVHAQGEFSQDVCGCGFKVKGSYFAQQNGHTTVCAHDSLLCALMNLRSGPSEIEIRRQLHAALTVLPGDPGPRLNQMVAALGALNVDCRVQDLEQAVEPEDYRGLVYATVESGYPAVLVFTTAHARHAVTVVGHTLNTDTWFPEVEFGYGSRGSAPKYHPSYDWAPHWLINDGNLGVYFCLEARAMRSVVSAPSPLVLPHDPLRAVAVIGLCEQSEGIVVKNAELKVAYLLEALTQHFASLAGRAAGAPEAKWLLHLLRTCQKSDPSAGPILRTFQTGRQQYLDHLFAQPDWNNNSFSPEDRKRLWPGFSQILSEKFWVTEFTLVDLYTANRRKLGEVVYRGGWSNSPDLVSGDLLLVRLPGLVWLPAAARSEAVPITSHTKILRGLPTGVGGPEY